MTSTIEYQYYHLYSKLVPLQPISYNSLPCNNIMMAITYYIKLPNHHDLVKLCEYYILLYKLITNDCFVE